MSGRLRRRRVERSAATPVPGTQTREARNACEGLLQELDLRHPLDLAGLCRAIEKRRGRTLRILPKDASNFTGPCGAVLSTDTEDLVFVEQGTSPVHGQHILLHELAHLLFSHGSVDDPDSDFISLLFPDLDTDTIRTMLMRDGYDSRAEEEAEMFATLLLADSQWRSRYPNIDDLPDAVRGVFGAFYAG